MKILYWKEDPAACNIVSNFREYGLDVPIIESAESLLFANEPEEDAELFVIPSTHKSESGARTLTVHATGNWGPSEMGGKPKELAFTLPNAMKIGLNSIAKANLENYEVCMEVTHHGPTWKKPLIFIEIGSSEIEWKDQEAGKVIANAIKDIYESKDEFKNYVGFGGTHYCPSFTKIELENEDIAMGHIAPKYASQYLDEKIIQQALERSYAEKAVIDWKGLKSEARNVVINALNKFGIEWKKTKDV